VREGEGVNEEALFENGKPQVWLLILICMWGNSSLYALVSVPWCSMMNGSISTLTVHTLSIVKTALSQSREHPDFLN
jgi:hypothetical protein